MNTRLGEKMYAQRSFLQMNASAADGIQFVNPFNGLYFHRKCCLSLSNEQNPGAVDCRRHPVDRVLLTI